MTQQYRDLVNTVNIEIREEDRRWVKRIECGTWVLRIFSLVLLITTFAIIGCHVVVRMLRISTVIPFDLLENVCLGVALAMPFGLFLYAISASAKVLSFLTRDCNPEKMLSACMTLLSRVKKHTAWGTNFYEICIGLSYEGRYEDIKKVLQLFPKYCPDNDSRFKYEYIWAKVTAHDKNEDALQIHCNFLNGFMQNGKLAKKNKKLYEDVMQTMQLLWMEKAGDYENAYAVYRANNEKARGILDRVVANYGMYRMAKCMGDEENAEKHRQVVLYYGETTWMKRKLEEETEAEKNESEHKEM